MSGNVNEWTCSQYKQWYDGSEQKCSVYVHRHSLRGGSWNDKPRRVRAANRLNSPVHRYDVIGFRLARDN